MVSNVKYPKFPPIGLRSAKGLFGLAVHLAILLGALLAPEYFLFPLGLFYVAFGLVRATVLGLMERQEQAVAAEDQLADAGRHRRRHCAGAHSHRTARRLDRPAPAARGPMSFRVHVRVMPRGGLLDPQGQAVEHALAALGLRRGRRGPRRPRHRARGGGAARARGRGAGAPDVRQAARQPRHRGLPARGGGRLMLNVAVVRFPGSNCDFDTAARRRAGRRQRVSSSGTATPAFRARTS